MMEMWSGRVFKGIEDSAPLSDMVNTKDDLAVCQLEFPLAAEGERESSSASPAGAGGAGRAVAIPSATGTLPGASSSSSEWSGQASSQGTGEGDGDGNRPGGAAGEAGVGPSVLIDLVLAPQYNSMLKGQPRRITCRWVLAGERGPGLFHVARRQSGRFGLVICGDPPLSVLLPSSPFPPFALCCNCLAGHGCIMRSTPPPDAFAFAGEGTVLRLLCALLCERSTKKRGLRRTTP